MTRVQWLICVIAAIGFAFDTYELLMLPLIVRPAVLDLTGAAPGTPEFTRWTGLLFYAPAVFGGVFGLLGGYLTDLLGRRRVLTWSILLYAFSAFAAGTVDSIEWLLFFRITTFIGVCVEFVAAVAWLAELFTDPKRREAVIGYTQAFGSVGGLMVTAAYAFFAANADSFPQVQGGHEAWRYTLMSGIIPAIPLIVIRPFLPESPRWLEARRAGTLKRPALSAIFAPGLRRTTIVTTLMVACSYAAAFGAIQHVPRMVPTLPQVQGLERPAVEQTVASVQLYQEIGGLAGRWLLALLAVRIVSRRLLLRLFQVPGLILLPTRLPGPGHQRRRSAALGHPPGRALHRRAVQLLGQLSAAHVPAPSARHRRELRRQRRRPHAGHRSGARHHRALAAHGRRQPRHQARLRRRGGRHRRLRHQPDRELLAARAQGERSAGVR